MIIFQRQFLTESTLLLQVFLAFRAGFEKAEMGKKPFFQLMKSASFLGRDLARLACSCSFDRIQYFNDGFFANKGANRSNRADSIFGISSFDDLKFSLANTCSDCFVARSSSSGKNGLLNLSHFLKHLFIHFCSPWLVCMIDIVIQNQSLSSWNLHE